MIDPSLSDIEALNKAPSTSSKLAISPDNNQAAYYYSEDIYEKSKSLKIALYVIVGLAGLGFLIGLINGKMIGV